MQYLTVVRAALSLTVHPLYMCCFPPDSPSFPLTQLATDHFSYLYDLPDLLILLRVNTPDVTLEKKGNKNRCRAQGRTRGGLGESP